MRERPKALIVGAGPTGLVMAHELARDGIQCRLIDLSKRWNALRCSGPALAAPRPAKPIARKPAVSSPRSTTGSPKASAHKTLKRQRRCSTNSADFMRGAGMAGGSSEARGGANTGAVQAPLASLTNRSGKPLKWPKRDVRIMYTMRQI